MAKTDPILTELQSATKGLLFPSETDAPMEAFVWQKGSGAPSEAVLRANVRVDSDAPIEKWTLAELEQTIPTESRDEFRPLFERLGRLSGTAVFKVGEINIDVYIVGRTADGRYAGVKTEVVET